MPEIFLNGIWEITLGMDTFIPIPIWGCAAFKWDDPAGGIDARWLVEVCMDAEGACRHKIYL